MKKINTFFNKLFKKPYEGLVFPITHEKGVQVKVNMYNLKRKFLKERWKYIAVTNTLIIIFGAFYVIQLRETIQAASYGFNQLDWSGGADTGAIATHDNNQDNYSKYYSKDNNINASVNQINLINASSTITETSTSDFDNGEINDGSVCIVTENGKLELITNVSYEGKNYPVVQISDQCWLGKNLNVGTRINYTINQANNSNKEKYCYSDNEANCTNYGGLYLWNEVMQYTATPGVQGLCPNGWHIPTDSELHTLENYYTNSACNSSRTDTYECSPAGTSLKSGGSSNFDAQFGGHISSGKNIYNLGTSNRLWSSSESGSNAWYRRLITTESGLLRGTFNKASALSVRCIKD